MIACIRISVSVAGIVLALCVSGASADEPRDEARVLILNGVDPYLPAYLAIDEAMRASLHEDGTRRIVFFSEALDAQRFSIEALEPEYLALLRKKYSALHIDVVVAVSRAALEFFKRHGATLWPQARVVYQGFPGEAVTQDELPTNATGVIANQDIRSTIALARRLQPEPTAWR